MLDTSCSIYASRCVIRNNAQPTRGVAWPPSPPPPSVVVIGAGIVGNSLVHHLAELGWTDIVQIDKGPLPNPGGSTGHASNFIFPVDHSREITDLTLDSVRQYKEMGVFTQSGGFEVARTEERMEELRRRMSSAKAWGIEAELVDARVRPGEGAVPRPRPDHRRLLDAGRRRRRLAARRHDHAREGPGQGRADRRAERRGRPASTSRTAGGSRRVRTDQGDIEAEYVVIACGVWSPKIGDMAGVNIALTPAVHQMISVGPCPQLAEREGEISFPIVRDMDTLCYERQHGADMEVGSYAHRAILHEPEEIPSIDQAKLSPTEMPFTERRLRPPARAGLELMPELLGAEGAEIRYAINGLLSLTGDGSADPRRERGQGPLGRGRRVDQGGPGRRPRGRGVDDPRPLRDRHPPQRHRALPPAPERREHTRLRTTESFIKTYGIVHPAEQYESDRGRGSSPMHESQKKLGAVFFETVGWERPFWYESNAGLLEEYGDAVMPREHEWDARWWSPIINAEHLAMREAAGVDRPDGVLRSSTSPARRPRAVQQTCVAQCDVAVGKVIYTPVLDAKGGFRSDLTVMRLGDDHFRVVTGGAHGMADLRWFTDHLATEPTLDRPHRGDLDDRPLGAAGPRHPRLADL